MVTKVASEFFDVGSLGLPVVDRPVNAVPSDSSVVGSQKPTLTSSGYSSLYGKVMAAAEYFVYDATGTVILQQSGVLTPVGGAAINSWQVPVGLPLNTDYQWSHKFRSTFGEEYIESAKTTFTVPTAVVGAPTILSPLEDTIPDNLAFDVQGSSFTTLGIAQNHDETTVEIATTSDFLTGLQTIVKSTGDLELVSVSVPSAATTYFIRMKYQGDVTGYSSVSDTVFITSVANSLVAPTITNPINFDSEQQSQVNATSSAFAYLGEVQTHDLVEWEVYHDEELLSPFFATGEISQDLESITISGFVEGQTYYIRKRDKGSLSGWSEWSSVNRFSTALVFSDWIGWDGTSDGIPLKASSLALAVGNAVLNSRGFCELGYEKYLVVRKRENQIDNFLQVAGVDGLSVSLGPTAIPGMTIHSSLSRLSATKAIVIGGGTSTNIYMRIADITGNNTVLGTSVLAVSTIMQYCSDVIGISDTQAIIIHGNSNFVVQYIDISGNVPSLGLSTTLTLGDGYTPKSSHDLLGNKLVAWSGVVNSGYLRVVDLDHGAQTAANAVVLDVGGFGGIFTGAHVRWLDASTIVVVVSTNVTSTDLSGKLLVYSYDGSATLTLESSTTIPNPSGDAMGLSLCKIDSENIMIQYSLSTTNTVSTQHIKVRDGLAYMSVPVVTNTSYTPTSELLNHSQIAIDSTRVLSLSGHDSTDTGAIFTVINGLA